MHYQTNNDPIIYNMLCATMWPSLNLALHEIKVSKGANIHIKHCHAFCKL